MAAIFGPALCDDDGILEAYGLTLRYLGVVDDFLRAADMRMRLVMITLQRTQLDFAACIKD